VTLGYSEYLYPDSGASADREASLSLVLPLPLQPTLNAFYGVGGAVEKHTYLELGVRQEVSLAQDLGLTLGATLGYALPDAGDSGFSHYSFQAELAFGPVAFSATYYGQLEDRVLPDENFDRELVVALKWSLEF